eukprot:TRINITY_DN41126_c0_g1_i1.p1 TRINITY_DN41126_c0_g1~~TRINITY_DN41126_c0_g1_i1.p1  ORF type:complete len:672 (+),score=108.38 TRINITY_DN41126_c0_g1_i1:24-2018(+)
MAIADMHDSNGELQAHLGDAQIQKMNMQHWRSRRRANCWLDMTDDVCLLVDPRCSTFPVVSVSAGFQRSTGFLAADTLDLSAQEVLTRHLPHQAISRSCCQNLMDFCRNCSLKDVDTISDTCNVQACARRDGSFYVGICVLGLCEVQKRPYVLICQDLLGEGLQSNVTMQKQMQAFEKCREILKRVRRSLCTGSCTLSKAPSSFAATSNSNSDDSDTDVSLSSMGSKASMRSHTCPLTLENRREDCLPSSRQLSTLRFFGERLQDHCMLRGGNTIASRREPEHLPNGCMVFSDRPILLSTSPSKGLHFSVKVMDATTAFHGLPLLGFTKRKPINSPELFPSVAKCLGESVFIGSGCQAFARDKVENFVMGFRKPSKEEIEVWSLSSDGKMMSGPELRVGDVLRCSYTRQGHLQLWVNSELFLSFDLKRPLDLSSDYYAVIDVALSVSSVAFVPSQVDSDGEASERTMKTTEHGGARKLFRKQVSGHGPRRLDPILSEGALPSLGTDSDSDAEKGMDEKLSSLSSEPEPLEENSCSEDGNGEDEDAKDMEVTDEPGHSSHCAPCVAAVQPPVGSGSDWTTDVGNLSKSDPFGHEIDDLLESYSVLDEWSDILSSDEVSCKWETSEGLKTWPLQDAEEERRTLTALCIALVAFGIGASLYFSRVRR